jgi:signal transduction histidine kinase
MVKPGRGNMNSIFSMISLFDGIPPEKLARKDIAMIDHFPEQGEILLNESDTGRGMSLVISGEVTLTKAQQNGSQCILEKISAGGHFGEVAALGINQQPARAIASGTSSTHTLEIEPVALQAMLAEIPELAARISTQLSTRLLSWNQLLWQKMEDAERLREIGLNHSGILHDLKTPLAAVMQTAYFLKHCEARNLRHLGEMTERSACRMVQLTQDVLDFSKGAPPLRLEPVSVAALFSRLSEEVRGKLRRKKGRQVAFSTGYDEDGVVDIDLDQILRAFVNLTVNAIEAMPDGGSLRVQATCRQKDVQFEFRDTGRGIAPEVLEHIYEPFVTEGKKWGTGLGMPITKNLVMAHDGDIQIKSTLGKGTSVYVSLPAHPQMFGEKRGIQ